MLPLILEPNTYRILCFSQRILATAKAIDRSLRETKGDAFVKRLHASLPKISYAEFSRGGDEVSAGNTDEETRKAYLKWATQTRFEYCDLSLPPTSIVKANAKGNREEDQAPNYKFYFNTEARMLAKADIPKRSLAIAKEV